MADIFAPPEVDILDASDSGKCFEQTKQEQTSVSQEKPATPAPVCIPVDATSSLSKEEFAKRILSYFPSYILNDKESNVSASVIANIMTAALYDLYHFDPVQDVLNVGTANKNLLDYLADNIGLSLESYTDLVTSFNSIVLNVESSNNLIVSSFSGNTIPTGQNIPYEIKDTSGNLITNGNSTIERFGSDKLRIKDLNKNFGTLGVSGGNVISFFSGEETSGVVDYKREKIRTAVYRFKSKGRGVSINQALNLIGAELQLNPFFELTEEESKELGLTFDTPVYVKRENSNGKLLLTSGTCELSKSGNLYKLTDSSKSLNSLSISENDIVEIGLNSFFVSGSPELHSLFLSPHNILSDDLGNIKLESGLKYKVYNAVKIQKFTETDIWDASLLTYGDSVIETRKDLIQKRYDATGKYSNLPYIDTSILNSNSLLTYKEDFWAKDFTLYSKTASVSVDLALNGDSVVLTFLTGEKDGNGVSKLLNTVIKLIYDDKPFHMTIAEDETGSPFINFKFNFREELGINECVDILAYNSVTDNLFSPQNFCCRYHFQEDEQNRDAPMDLCIDDDSQPPDIVLFSGVSTDDSSVGTDGVNLEDSSATFTSSVVGKNIIIKTSSSNFIVSTVKSFVDANNIEITDDFSSVGNGGGLLYFIYDASQSTSPARTFSRDGCQPSEELEVNENINCGTFVQNFDFVPSDTFSFTIGRPEDIGFYYEGYNAEISTVNGQAILLDKRFSKKLLNFDGSYTYVDKNKQYSEQEDRLFLPEFVSEKNPDTRIRVRENFAFDFYRIGAQQEDKVEVLNDSGNRVGIYDIEEIAFEEYTVSKLSTTPIEVPQDVGTETVRRYQKLKFTTNAPLNGTYHYKLYRKRYWINPYSIRIWISDELGKELICLDNQFNYILDNGLNFLNNYDALVETSQYSKGQLKDIRNSNLSPRFPDLDESGSVSGNNLVDYENGNITLKFLDSLASMSTVGDTVKITVSYQMNLGNQNEKPITEDTENESVYTGMHGYKNYFPIRFAGADSWCLPKLFSFNLDSSDVSHKILFPTQGKHYENESYLSGTLTSVNGNIFSDSSAEFDDSVRPRSINKTSTISKGDRAIFNLNTNNSYNYVLSSDFETPQLWPSVVDTDVETLVLFDSQNESNANSIDVSEFSFASSNQIIFGTEILDYTIKYFDPVEGVTKEKSGTIRLNTPIFDYANIQKGQKTFNILTIEGGSSSEIKIDIVYTLPEYVDKPSGSLSTDGKLELVMTDITDNGLILKSGSVFNFKFESGWETEVLSLNATQILTRHSILYDSSYDNGVPVDSGTSYTLYKSIYQDVSPNGSVFLFNHYDFPNNANSIPRAKIFDDSETILDISGDDGNDEVIVDNLFKIGYNIFSDREPFTPLGASFNWGE